jgi:hypothetical protein
MSEDSKHRDPRPVLDFDGILFGSLEGRKRLCLIEEDAGHRQSAAAGGLDGQ